MGRQCIPAMSIVKVYPITPATPPDMVFTLPSSWDQSHLSLSVKCSLCCETHKKALIILGILLIIGLIGAVIGISQGASSSAISSTNPCEVYRSDDFASSVSLECFRYMWGNSGCKTTVPDGYTGWYLRSPDGGKTVLCIPPKTGSLCGAGSFGTIQNSIWHCNLDYKGY